MPDGDAVRLVDLASDLCQHAVRGKTDRASDLIADIFMNAVFDPFGQPLGIGDRSFVQFAR
jgi:hypothetical protein